jgi:hypothetical protein
VFEKGAVRRAIAKCRAVTPLTFTEQAYISGGAPAHFEISWVTKANHADLPNGAVVLPLGLNNAAHGDYPPRCSIIAPSLPKLLHFNDDDFVWSTTPSANEMDIESVALHEIGHIIGLGHSSVQNAVMFAGQPLGVRKRTLTADDTTGLLNLYPNQPNWRWCSKCQGLFQGAAQATSRCPAGGTHDGSDSANYILARDIPAGVSQQDGWRQCSKCKGLYYSLGVNAVCPSGGVHTALAGGANFVLSEFPPPRSLYEQTLWGRCLRCEALFFEGGLAKNRCPRGGGHSRAFGDRQTLEIYVLNIRWDNGRQV